MASNNMRFAIGNVINNSKLLNKRSNFYVNVAKFIHKDSLFKSTLNNVTQILRHESNKATNVNLGDDVTSSVPLDKQNRAETPTVPIIERNPIVKDAPKAEEMNILRTGESHSDYTSREKETKRNLDMKMNEGDIFEFHTGKVCIDGLVEEGQQTAKAIETGKLNNIGVEKNKTKVKLKVEKTTYTPTDPQNKATKTQ